MTDQKCQKCIYWNGKQCTEYYELCYEIGLYYGFKQKEEKKPWQR